MEDKEQTDSESHILPCAEQTQSLSVVLSVEEEATEMRSNWGLNPAEEDSVANGYTVEEREEGVAGTSYWSVTEGPDTPLLLSPVPGPTRGKAGKRASRTGSSRIPGRDHRRYYHEYWRAEFLMDFDPERHRMLCMVCGSSLATLKLSTIKRHIQQKHPQSLLWSAAEKEAIRVGWDTHLTLQGAHSPDRAPSATSHHQEGVPDYMALSTGKTGPETSEKDPPSRNPVPTTSPTSPEVWEPPGRPSSPGPPTHTLERYLNDSFHAWFRQEVLMEYRGEEGCLVCMVCSQQLPSLHLDHIKRHVLDLHPVSLLYSAEERHHILQTWAQKQESAPLCSSASVKCDPEPAGGGASADPGATGGGGGPHHPPRNKSPRAKFPRRWYLDYLVARCPERRGVVCMVCSQTLPVASVSAFRRHIRQRHPDSGTLSRAERRALADAWAERAGPSAEGGVSVKAGQEDSNPASDTTPKEGGAKAARLGRYLGRDQRRNYQVRWRTEYLMDYDTRRRGLVCMVCGATLATLKVSTIKRHIGQVHPASLVFTAEQREEALARYSNSSPHALPSASLRTSRGGSGQPA